MRRALVLAVLLAPPAAAQEAKAPVRAGFTGAPVVTPIAGSNVLTPIVTPSLPVTPTASSLDVKNLLLKAAAAAFGYGQTVNIPAAQVPLALGLAPGRDLTPPPLPGSALDKAQSASAQLPGAAGLPAQPGLRQSNPNLNPGGIIPLVFKAGTHLPALAQKADTISGKSEALKQPLETATGLTTTRGASVGDEAAKRLGDGIWSVMMDEPAPREGGDLALRDALASPDSSRHAHETGAERATLEALDYSSLAFGPTAAASAAQGAWGGGSAATGALGEHLTSVTGMSGEFVAEAVGAAEAARRFARQNLIDADDVSRAQGARRGRRYGPVERVWIQTVEAVLNLFSTTAGPQKIGRLKPGWSAEPNSDATGGARDVSSGGRLGRGRTVVVGELTASSASGSSNRLVRRLAAANPSKPGGSVSGPGFTVPAPPKAVPDALLGLSLLPLLVLALAYAGEFKR